METSTLDTTRAQHTGHETGWNHGMTAEEDGRLFYMDLLVAVLTQYEEGLSRLIEKLEELNDSLTRLKAQISLQGKSGHTKAHEADEAKMLQSIKLKVAKYIH